MNAQCHLYFKALPQLQAPTNENTPIVIVLKTKKTAKRFCSILFFYSGVRDVLTGYPSCWLRYDLLRCNRRVFLADAWPPDQVHGENSCVHQRSGDSLRCHYHHADLAARLQSDMGVLYSRCPTGIL